MKRLNLFLALASISQISNAAPPQLNQNGGGGTFFNEIISFMQTWVDFIAGPWAILIVFAGIAIAVFLWIIAPKAGEFIGYALRTCVGGFIIFNVASLISMMM